MDPQKQYMILEEQFIQKIAQLPKLDLICVDGDIFDHKVSLSSDATLYASLFVSHLVEVSKLKQATLIILQGTLSHDANQLKMYYHYMERNDVDVRVVTNIRFEIVKNARVLCIPELYGVNEAVYQNAFHHDGWYDECYLHGTFEGSVYGNTVGNGRLFTMQDFDLCKGFMIGGHVHKPQVLQGYFYYCGNPYRWKFGEEEDKGFFITIHDLDMNTHDVHFEKIMSKSYITINLEDIKMSDPQEIIRYIDDYKKNKGIDFLKVKFKYALEGANKVIVNNYYRNSRTVFVEFLSIMEEQKAKAEATGEIDEGYAFLLDDKLSDEEKFVHYCNMQEGSEFITVDKLKEILSETL
jgi:DNA repair exonuclease SbcCD nuclease subunit